MINRFNSQTIKLLLQYVPAKDALSLRACNKLLNNLIANCQEYWYMQNQRLTKLVHLKLFSQHCFNSYNMKRYFDYLLENDEDGDVATYTDLSRNMGYTQNRLWRYVCLKFNKRFPQHMCGRHRHYISIPILFAEYKGHTKEYKEGIDIEKHGLQMYKFLFESFKNLKKKIKAIDEAKLENLIDASENTISKLESDLRVERSKLDMYVNYADKKKLLDNSLFFRKRQKIYHKRKEVRATFGLSPMVKKRKKVKN